MLALQGLILPTFRDSSIFSPIKDFCFIFWIHFVWNFLIRIRLKYWFDRIDIFIKSISYSFKNHGRRKHRRANQENEGGHSKRGQTKSTLHRRKGWGVSWHRKSIHHQGLKVKNWPRIFQFHQTVKGQGQNVILILISAKSLQSSTGKELKKCRPDMNSLKNWNPFFSKNFRRGSVTRKSTQNTCITSSSK